MAVKVPTYRADWEAQGLNSHTYNKFSPLTGTTITLPNDASMVSIRPAGTLAALTVVFPPGPVDGQTIRLFSTQILTALTLQVSPGQTLNDGITTIATAMTGAAWCFSSANATWDRVL